MTLNQQELIITLLAILGGIIVLLGLWMEHKSAKGWYSNLSDFRKQKKKGEYGYKLVMVGIFLETLIGGWFAYQDVAEMWRNDPNNQPITSVGAEVNLLTEGTNHTAAY